MADGGTLLFGRTEVIASEQVVALTIGNFDGVHLGHQQVLKKLIASSHGCPTVALTFHPHPTVLLSPELAKPSLSSLQQRVQLLLATGIDVVVVQNFSKEFASLSADEFITDYLLKRFKLSAAVLGFDFCYGAQRKGNWEHFEKSASRYGFAAFRSEPYLMHGLPVSSSRIRSAIQQRDFQLASEMLGRDFSLSGIVVQGDQRGRQLGFPTANLGLEEQNILIPPYGVYAVEILLPNESAPRFGVMNCGVRPTIAQGLKLQIEAHILDFDADIYGSNVRFSLKKFIRTEMKFSGLDHLKAQIQDDVTQARIFFGV
jgi:riboflavin kinase/FMN adenylyltransferase